MSIKKNRATSRKSSYRALSQHPFRWKEWSHHGRMLLSRRLNRSLAPPDRVSVNLTLRCNLSCVMCSTCYDAPELSFEEVCGIIDQTASWGVEVFNPLGGEPFMRGDIEDILAYAVKKGFYVSLTTNGTLISERRAQRIAEIPADRLHFNFSLDGNKSSNDLVRGAGNWKRAVEGYLRLREADQRLGNSRRKILTNTILHAGNIEHFEELLAEQQELGFDGVQILNLFREGADTPAQGKDLWFQEEHHSELKALTERLAQRVEQGQQGFLIQNEPAELRRILSYYQEALSPLEAPCWAGFKELYINADGQAIMCDGKLDFLNGAFGSVREQSLRELWASEELQERRSVVKKCSTPCAQGCYLRAESDSGTALLQQAVEQISSALPSPPRPWRLLKERTLILELSDVNPSDQEGANPLRWQQLTAGCSEPLTAEGWIRMRNRGELSFDRGFMGFEVIRRVVSELKKLRIRLGKVALAWRGEPLIHPEFEPIYAFLQEQVRKELFGEVVVPTSGLFLTEAAASKTSMAVPQTWIFDLNEGQGAGLELLNQYRSRESRQVLRRSIQGVWPAEQDILRYPHHTPVVGRFPHSAHLDVLWFTRADYSSHLQNASAREALREVAIRLNLPFDGADIGTEDRPPRCYAPDRELILSWDGKLALCQRDRQLKAALPELNHNRLEQLLEHLEGLANTSARQGTPQQSLCRDCGFHWSPNAPQPR